VSQLEPIKEGGEMTRIITISSSLNIIHRQ